MNKHQMMVREFHDKLGQPVVIGGFQFSRALLRSSLIREEAEETCDAIDNGNFIETIDGLCDLLYVTYGTALEFGVDLDPYFSEVHLTNMMKVGGPTRLDGKVLKPEGWKPPRIAEMLKAKIGVIK